MSQVDRVIPLLVYKDIPADSANTARAIPKVIAGGSQLL